jgi:transcription initiation factor IIE alpha subunit
MAWFVNHYACETCGCNWTDEWSCACDDECPHCGSDISATDSDDRTRIIEKRGDVFAVLRSPPSAEDSPNYRLVIEFRSMDQAKAFLR